MKRETGAALVIFGIILIVIAYYLYTLASGAEPIFSIFEQICNSSLRQGAQVIIPNATQTCSHVNTEVLLSRIGIDLAYALIIIGSIALLAGGLSLGRSYYHEHWG